MNLIDKEEYSLELGASLYDAIYSSESETEDLILYVDSILEAGANVNYKDFESGNTSIMLAIKKNYPRCFNTLLKKDPDLESANVEGIRAVHLASSSAESFYLTELTKKEVDINAPDKHHNRPINYAIKNCVIENISCLFKKKCILNSLNNYGMSIYDEATLTGNDEVIKLVFNPSEKHEHKLKRLFNKLFKNV